MVSSRMSGCGNRAAHAECWLSRRVSEDTRTNHGQATAVAIKRAALTKTWVLDKLIENVDRAHRSRWSPRARGEGWWPIIRLLGPQVFLETSGKSERKICGISRRLAEEISLDCFNISTK